MIFGADTRPSTVTIAVTSVDWVSATKWICGSRLPTSCSEPSSKSMRWPSTISRPRRRSNWPTGWMSVVVPRMRSPPPSSTSRPRPRTKIWFGALMRTSRPMPGPVGPGRGCGAPTRARSSVTCTGGGVSTWITCSSAACEAPRPSAIEISVRPRSMVPASRPPPPTSGPVSVSEPSRRVLTNCPSV